MSNSIQFVVQNQPAYLVGSLFFILTWSILYWKAPKSRHAILWASVTFLPIGPFLESLYIIDYWSPQHWWYIQWGWLRVSLEDEIFTFTCSGMCAGFFDLAHRSQKHRAIEGITLGSYLRLLFGGSICLGLIWTIWCYGRAHQIRALHSVNCHAISCLLTLPFVCVRRTWLISALSAALGGAVFMLIFYCLYYVPIYPNIFQRWWMLDHLSGIRLFGVPIEEVYWMFTTTLFIGPIVRFCMATTEDKKWLAWEQFRGWREGRGGGHEY